MGCIAMLERAKGQPHMNAQQSAGSCHSASIGLGQPCSIKRISTPASAKARSNSARHAAAAFGPATGLAQKAPPELLQRYEELKSDFA